MNEDIMSLSQREPKIVSFFFFLSLSQGQSQVCLAPFKGLQSLLYFFEIT